jgi:hypothetical protein
MDLFLNNDILEGSFMYDFKGYGGCKSKCKVSLIKEEHHTIVVFTDIGMGTSVTNYSEHLATQIRELLGLDPTTTLWAEEYHAGKKEHTLDQIQYNWDEDAGKYYAPKWRHIPGGVNQLREGSKEVSHG